LIKSEIKPLAAAEISAERKRLDDGMIYKKEKMTNVQERERVVVALLQIILSLQG
jgi:hypothetical protein